MGFSGDIRRNRLARLAKPMNAVLLLLVTSLVLHWALASSLAATKEATRSNVAPERITPMDAENHLALVRNGVQNIAISPVDQRLASVSVFPEDRDDDRVAPPELSSFLGSYSSATAFHRFAPVVSPEKAFQARGPPRG